MKQRPYRQIANLHRGLPIVFGNEHTEQRYLAEVKDALRNATAPFVVAPRCQLKTARGTLQAGAAVSPGDFGPLRFGELLRSGHILKSEDALDPSPPPQAA